MEIARINKTELFVLSLGSSEITKSIEDLSMLKDKIDGFKSTILDKIANICIMSESLSNEEIKRHSVFSEISSTSGDIKEISENIMSDLMDNISQSKYLTSSSTIDFRKNDERAVLSYGKSPYYNTILGLVNFSKQIGKNVRFFASKTVTLSDIEKSINNDQSIFTVFLKSLAVNLSSLNELSVKVISYKDILEDSLTILSDLETAEIDKEEFFELSDIEKINTIVSG